MSIRIAMDEGSAVIVGGVPYVRYGKVYAQPSTPIDTQATIHLEPLSYAAADDNGLKDYSAAQRAISKIPAHSGTSGSLWPNNPTDDGVHANFFTAPRTGVMRVINTAGQGGYGGDVYVNDVLVKTFGAWDEPDADFIMLLQGDIVGGYSTNTQISYTFLPDLYPY